MQDINNATQDEKRKALLDWINQSDEFVLDSLLIEFLGWADNKEDATPNP
jgi:hypothetical protein